MGESDNFKLAHSSSATTTAIWDMVFSGIKWNKQTTWDETLYLPIYSLFLKLGDI